MSNLFQKLIKFSSKFIEKKIDLQHSWEGGREINEPIKIPNQLNNLF